MNSRQFTNDRIRNRNRVVNFHRPRLLPLSFPSLMRIERFIETKYTKCRAIITAAVNCTLMDYVRRTVTFELRSIIRNCAIKIPPGATDVKDYTYICTTETRPRVASRRGAPSSDFNKNVKFYFQIRRHHRRAHRSCSLSLLNLSYFGVPCHFVSRLFP